MAPKLRLIVENTGVREIDLSDILPRVTNGKNPEILADKSGKWCSFVSLSNLSHKQIQSLFSEISPDVIIDLRLFPTFSFGSLNRRKAFDLFRKSNARYFDINGRIEATGVDVQSSNADQFVGFVDNFIRSKNILDFQGVLFLVDEGESTSRVISLLEKRIQNHEAWAHKKSTVGIDAKVSEKSLLTPVSEDASERDMIFISHANPRDNEFTMWLASQLTKRGFSVWTDLDELNGGESFWNVIENVIRDRTAKFLLVVSKDSISKEGVMDELNFALQIERKFSIPDFVVPLKVDDTDFLDMGINIQRKFVLDFTSNWSEGLARLEKKLYDDEITHDTENSYGKALDFLHAYQANSVSISTDPEVLVANRLEVVSLPKYINFFVLNNVDNRGIRNLVAGLEAPAVTVQEFGRLICTTLSQPELSTFLNEEMGLREREGGGKFPFSSLISSECPSGFPIRDASARRRTLVAIFSKLMVGELTALGLSKYHLANDRICWFYTASALPIKKIQIVNSKGKRTWINLWGKSERYRAYWHFGVDIHPIIIGSNVVVSLRPHVIFSKDGERPLERTSDMHRLRRSFCKSWWNDRWRNLLSAFVNSLNSGNSNFVAGRAFEDSLELSNELMRFECPVSLTQEVEISAAEVDQALFDAINLDFEFEQEEWSETDVEMEGYIDV